MFHTKSDMAAHLAKHPEVNQNEIARHHGWKILDLTCQCGAEVNSHLVDARSTIEGDLNVKPCANCGARGQWKHKPAVKEPKAKPSVAKSILSKLGLKSSA